MDNYIDLQASFKFGISLNISKNLIDFKPDGFLEINGKKIKIIIKFAKYCSQKIKSMYTNQIMNSDNKKSLKINIEKDKWIINDENLEYLQSFFCMKSVKITKENIKFLKFISKELEINILENAISIFELSIEDNFSTSSKAIKILKNDDKFQNSLDKYSNEKNMKDIQTKIQNLNFNDHYLPQSITNFCISRPFKMGDFIEIVKTINKLDEYSKYLKKNLESNSLFHNEKEYLLNLVNSEISSDYQLKNDPTANILQIIQKDDINEFQRITSTTPNFDFNLNICKICEKRISLFNSISEILNEKIDNFKFSYIDYSAFFGSVEIFKFLIMKKVEMNRFISLFAVAGGNNEIIHICDQHKCCFKNALKIAIVYRRDNLFDWLIETINADSIESIIQEIIMFHRNDLLLKLIDSTNQSKIIQFLIVKCIIYDNFQMFSFLNNIENIDFKYKFDKNKTNILSLLTSNSDLNFYDFLFNSVSKNVLEESNVYGQTPAHIAAENGNVKLIKLLYEKGCNIEARAYDDLTPLHFACMRGHYDIVEYFASLPNINLNCLDRTKQSPLTKACINKNPNCAKIAELLINNLFVKCNYIDLYGKSIILNSIQNANDGCSLLLINCNKDIAVNKSDIQYNPLCLACKSNKIDIVKALIKRNDIKINELSNCGILFIIFHLAPIHCAISNSTDILKLLLDISMIDVNICTRDISIYFILAKFLKLFLTPPFIWL